MPVRLSREMRDTYEAMLHSRSPSSAQGTLFKFFVNKHRKVLREMLRQMQRQMLSNQETLAAIKAAEFGKVTEVSIDDL